ncbi:MAG TPA: PDZ domain-containing protein, partial [Phycisphaerae bacterium]|nr:PDZ domain-containing protein [Phycisphaerae bacterium]
IGSAVKFNFQRKDEIKEVSVATEKLRKDRGESTSLRSWGITVSEMTQRIALEMHRPDTSGALVNGVRSGGPADLAEPALNFGDIILKVEGKPVASMEALVKLYKRIMEVETPPEYVLIEFDREGKNHLTVIKPKPDEPNDPPRDIRKAWIGLATQPIVEKLAKKLGGEPGFRITRVYPRTRAADSDLRVGDLIVALNGEKLRIQGMQDAGLLARLIKKLDPSGAATLSVVRGEEKKDVEVQLELTRPGPSEARRIENKDFEMTVRNITFFDRDENQWEKDVKGVIVEQVESGGWASMGGIRSDDLIQKINEYPIQSRTSYRKAMKKITEEKPERVVFLVLRGIQTRFQFVEPEWNPELKEDAAASTGEAGKQNETSSGASEKNEE